MAICEAQYRLLKIAHIAGIFPPKQIIVDGFIEFRWLTIWTSLTQEMFSEWNNVFVAVAKRWQSGYEAGDPVIEIRAELASTNKRRVCDLCLRGGLRDRPSAPLS